MRPGRTGRRRWGVAVVVATCLASVVGAVSSAPALAAAGDISTFAGSRGEGPATRIAQMPVAPAVHGRTLYLSEGFFVRAVDLDSGLGRIVAGTGQWGSTGDGGPATEATLNASSIAVDPAGNLFVVDDYRIRRVDTTGRITAVAGGGTRRDEGAPARETDLGGPGGIAIDAAGALYYSDTSSKKVRRIDPAGTVTTVAGVGVETSPVFSGDGGPALLADLYGPGDLAFDPAGRLHLIDGPRVRRVDAQGIITTVAGGGTYPWGANGVRATDVQLTPFGLAFDGAGNLYIAEASWLRKVDGAGRITTIAGNGLPWIRHDQTEVEPGDGEPAVGVALVPLRVTVDAAGDIYLTEWGRGRARRITPSGIITTVAGNGTKALGGDGGPARHAQLNQPHATVADPAGNVYIADSGNGRVRRVSPGGTITSLPQKFTRPSRLALDGAGRLYVVASSVVFRVDPDGLVTRLAGGGVGEVPDGARATAGHVWAGDIALDKAGTLSLTDGSRIRTVDAAGIITTVAGGGFATPEDGLLARSAVLAPTAIASDSAGRILFTDSSTNRIWRIEGGRLRSVAGTTQGFSGDGGPASAAKLHLGPFGGLALDGADQIFVLDFMNLRVRRIDTAGTITTVAGSGPGFDPSLPHPPPPPGEGVPATSTPIVGIDVDVDPAGNLYLIDPFHSRIRIVPGIGLAAPPPSPAAALLAAPATRSTTGGRAAAAPAPATASAIAPVPAPAPAPATASSPAPALPAPAGQAASNSDGVATAAGAGHHALASAPSRPERDWTLAAASALAMAAGATSSAWLRRRRAG